MSIITALLLLCAVAAVLMLLCALVIYLEKNNPSKEYDERQKQARGNAYRFSFWVGIAYYFVMHTAVLWYFPKELRPGNVAPFFLYGFVLQAVAFYIYCFFTHADMPLSENPKFSVFFYCLLGLWNLAQFMMDFDGRLTIFEPGSQNISGLMSGFFFLFLAALNLIQFLRNRKEENE